MNTLLLRGCTKLFHLYVTRVTQRMRSENCNWYLSDFYAVATRQTTLCRTSKIAVGADHVAQKIYKYEFSQYGTAPRLQKSALTSIDYIYANL